MRGTITSIRTEKPKERRIIWTTPITAKEDRKKAKQIYNEYNELLKWEKQPINGYKIIDDFKLIISSFGNISHIVLTKN